MAGGLVTQTQATTVQVSTDEGQMLVHVRGADGDPPVLVLMPAPGVTEGLLEIADRLADEGFRALVPELYHRLGDGVTFGPDDGQAMRVAMAGVTDAMAVADIGAVLASLDPGADVGVIGFCMGGRFALRAMAAFPDRVVAGAALHPSRLLQDGDSSPHLDIARINGPLYVGFGRDDSIVPPQHWSAVDEQVTKHRKPVQIEVHPGAEHGYMLRGPRYLASAAEASWVGTLDALDALRD
jgi:carboxymethylenebutenolidase